MTEGSSTTTESEREVILNEVLTDLATASCLLYGTEDSASVQYGDFYVDDPDELERIMAEIQALLGADWQSCTLTRYGNDYQNAKESLQGSAKYRFLSRLP
ncbi:MAG: hypothetical protein HFE91_12085 [Acutalibacter sp.]|uniref:hypothetical protein n=1 Tax=Acutalibacter sp. TaxID=1918636 RepID=UPI00217453C3|nr:hypothetical protein [Acutalibacter sp.]MCI9226183.1 hypothetical protein [Acutalibacter sp.]